MGKTTVTDCDFGGYATKAGLKCTDGLTIAPGAFTHQDKQRVPLLWHHGHDNVENVLGHADLEDRGDGMYAYAYFNTTPAAIHAKQLVEHGDVKSLSIYANRIKVTKQKLVTHGNIIETSMVLNGANEGAKIDFVRLAHGDGTDTLLDDEVVIMMDLPIRHGDMPEEDIETEAIIEHKTQQDVFDSLDDDQLGLFEIMLKKALEESSAKHSDDSGADESGDDKKDLAHQEGAMPRNAFEQNKVLNAADGGTRPVLSHADVEKFLKSAEKAGSFKEFVLEHAEGDYGITNIEMLFPDAQAIDQKPEWITRKMAWVEDVIGGTRKLPWSRIKSLSADLTHAEARAKGYIKGTMKKEQYFEIARRDTTPTTIYKKQKLDRDDIVDITDFDVVAWLWIEMYFMIREEFARAVLIGDGREIDDPDKIIETKIRPIAYDDPFYTDLVTVPANTTSDTLIELVLRNRYKYKGVGPKAYMTNAVMTDMLLLKDGMLRRYYETKAALAAALGVSEIVEVEVMEGAQRNGGDILMIIVNMGDYAVGSTRGGELTKFDDFDIDYNQYKYLIETRASGALVKHKTAQVFVREGGTEVTPTVPAFNSTTGVVTIPAITGVVYKNQLTNATLSSGAQTAIDAGATITIKAVPAATYYFPHNFDADWAFTRLL